MSPTTTPEQTQALVAAQGQTRQQLTAQVAAIASASAAAFTGWYSSEQITQWAASLAKTVDPILKVLAQNTDAYMAKAVSDLSGRKLRPVGAVDVGDLRQGVTHAGAYARAADVYRWQQSQLDQIAKIAMTDVQKAQGMLGLVDPLQAARDRVEAVADLDTQLVVTRQAQKTMQAGEQRGLVTGWRRVIHPELSIGGTCGLCVAASDRVYHVDTLQPLHLRCNCIPSPILDHNDPGSIINEQDLKRVYGDAGGTGGKGLKRTRYSVDEHGELGPVLNDGTFRTPKRVRDSTDVNVPKKTPEEKRADLDRIHGQLADSLPKLRELAHDTPKLWGKYVDQMEARVAELERELTAA